ATDINGYFTITKIPDGNYSLVVTYLGFDTLREDVTVKGNTVLSKKYYLTKAAYILQGVSISAEHAEQRNETRTSVVKVTPKQIKQIPSIGGQADLAQYLQVLPGVVFTGDQGGQLYIRGGSPIQNKVQLDGMVIYNPFHSIGLFSVFETDLLRSADIYSGGFGAEMGGRISSVMDLTTRDGNKKRIAGKMGASTFGAKILLEGPIIRQKNDNGGSSSFLLSYKNSYLEQTSKILYSYIDENGLPFNYNDFYGKVSLNSSNGSKINFFGFSYNDRATYKAVSNYAWDAAGGGTNFIIIPGASSVLIDGNIAFSNYKIALDETNRPSRTSSISGFNGGFNINYFMGKNQLKFGFEMLGFATDFNYTNSANRVISQTQFTSEIAPFVTYKLTRNKWLIEPGFRLQYYASLSNASAEPRLAIKYLANEKLRFKFAGGFYSQNLIAANSDRDVVNLFYGFLSGSDEIQDEFNGKELTHKLQKSQHIVLGVEVEPANHITINIEAYYKNFSQLTNINRNKLFEDIPPYNDPTSISYKPEYLRKDFIVETGDAEGIDFSFKYNYNRIYLWAAYSLAYVHRFDGIEHYVPHYDRRHNMNLLVTYQFGKLDVWEVNARWNFGSGFPFTQTQGFYESLNFPNGMQTDITTDNGELGLIYGDYNAGRLSSYHRLDVGITRKFNLSESSILEANFTITNLYDRDNIFYVDRVSNEKVYQLPIMPSFGMTWSF
ncbi:TonB-dependent receptor plug domain-containing protein, partial [bacterium]|nr:TonB-dependent receptor plug domain-containing protein [bacterium]